MRKAYFFLALIILFSALGLLVSGSSLLVVDIGNGFPLGTIITWIGIIALPSTILFGNSKLLKPENKKLQIYQKILFSILLTSISWGFVAFLLAGNWAYTFEFSDTFQGSQNAGLWFWTYSIFVTALPLLFLLIYFLDVKFFTNKK